MTIGMKQRRKDLMILTLRVRIPLLDMGACPLDENV
jgi:hypothetical protein